MHTISVVIPTHNRPKDLRKAIKSVFNQTLLPSELIVVDDGSDPKVTSDIFENKPNQVLTKLVRNKTAKGGNYSRNKGAKISNSNFLIFLDDDDLFTRNRIKKHVNIFRENPQVGLIYTGKQFFKYSGDEVDIVYKSKKEFTNDSYPEILVNNFIGSTSAASIKKDVFLKAGGFDTNLPAMQDFDLWVRICRISSVKYDGEFNLFYNLGSTDEIRKISNNPFKYLEATKIIAEKYQEEFNENFLFGTKRILSNGYYMVAKILKKQGEIKYLLFFVKSFLTFPQIRTLSLLIPQKVRSKFST